MYDVNFIHKIKKWPLLTFNFLIKSISTNQSENSLIDCAVLATEELSNFISIISIVLESFSNDDANVNENSTKQ